MADDPDSSAMNASESPRESTRPAIEPSGVAAGKGQGRWMARSWRTLRSADSQGAVVNAAARLRRILPGDSSYGDPLSTAGSEPHAVVSRTVNALSTDRPSATRELGLGALQVWQALSESQGRGRGDQEVTLLFTDLVGFSSWALKAGDATAVDLLREVGRVVEGAVGARGGRVVKRLGDGVMATFTDPAQAVRAILEAQRELAAVEVAGYRPRMRAGVHRGRPRRLGGDYLGLDVNIAARVAEAAGPDEVLVSDTVCACLDEKEFPTGRGKRLKAPGAPRELRVHALG